MATRRVGVANAGKVPPLVRHFDGQVSKNVKDFESKVSTGADPNAVLKSFSRALKSFSRGHGKRTSEHTGALKSFFTSLKSFSHGVALKSFFTS